MSAAPRVPISQLLSDKSTEDEPKKKSREDWRKAKELEEARKAGTAPAAVDETGKDINPHIPQYISAAPWYYNTQGPTLKHQRPQEEKQRQFSGIEDWYKRGVDTSKVATKFRKGACENCGAMTHKKKECMERPRKIGAKFTNAKIAPDEYVQPNLNPDYDGKRDRWAGYDPAQHQEVIEEYEKIEEAKRQMRAEKLKEDPNASNDEEDEADEDKYADDFDMPGTKVDSKQRITVRNLRIREDTAKYLRNLDPNSAYYDPKTRSMRDNPNPAKPTDETDFAGENFVRYSGDTQTHAKAQLFAWEAYGKGVDVHVLAEPTKLELLQKEYEKKKDEIKSEVKNSVLEKYGGEEHLDAPPKALLLAQTETYVEYSRYGKVIKGQEKPIIRSRYEEDVYINNHTAVWGSYWHNFQWGYKCCHSFIKNSYCVGESGKDDKTPTIIHQTPSTSQDTSETTTKKHKKKDGDEKSSDSSSSSSSSSESEHSDDSEKTKKKRKKRSKKQKQKEKRREKRKAEKEASKLKLALMAEENNKRRAELLLGMDERKRPYNSMYESKAPTEEEMEAYQLKRAREEDPMIKLMEK